MSFPVRERGLKQCFYTLHRVLNIVVPRAGTWIETLLLNILLFITASFPVRERGLKPPGIAELMEESEVVPRAGTWIETNWYS